MSYHGLGVTASASLNFGGGGFSASGSAGGGSAGSGSSGDYIWDSTCNLGSRGGTKEATSNSSGFSFRCNNGYACKGGPGKTTTCTSPGSSATVPGPPAPPGPCGSVGARTSNAKNGYTYTYCNDDRMYVLDPKGKWEVFSQKEVGGAFNAGSAIMPKTTTLDMSWLFPSKPSSPPTLNASAAFQPKKTLATTKMFAAPPPLEVMQEGEKAPREVDCSVPGSCLPSTATMVAVGVGVVALVGGIAYAVTRRK